MSVVGVDLGNDGMVISAASGQGKSRGGGGIDIVLNEASHRRTQSLVSFQNDQRFIGESAANLTNSNLRNTITGLKRFIGCKYNESVVQEEIKTSGVRIVALDNNRIGFKVNVNDEKEEVFTPEQLLAMLLYRVKEITDIYTGNVSKSFDVVLSVPPYYSECQRRSIIDACTISNIKCLRLLNENVCAAVTYGIYKSHQGIFDANKYQYVMFVDMGQASCYASVVGFVTGKLEVMSVAYDRHLGGRDIDNSIVEVIADEFKKKHGIDPRENKKSMIKLRRAAEVTKKNLSPVGMTKTPINIECVYEDYDYNGHFELSTLVDLMKTKELDKKISAVVTKALNDFRAIEPNEPIVAYEIIGGSLRVPLFKETLSTLLNLDKSLPNMGLSTTLNMDECVAIGAGWLSAILSPRFRIKDYSITDRTHFPVHVKLNGCDQKEIKVTSFPHDIIVKREGKSPISIDVNYPDECKHLFPDKHEMKIGHYEINPHNDVPEGTPITIRFGYDQWGLFAMRAISKYEKTVQVMVEVDDDEEESKKEKTEEKEKSSETKTEKGDEKDCKEVKEEKKEKVKEKKQKMVEEKSESIHSYEIIRTEYYKINPTAVSNEEIKQFRQLEAKMRHQDQEIRDRSARRNDLESYIYNTKENIGDIGAYGRPEEKYSLQDLLEEYGKWLYSDAGHEAKTSDFESKLHNLLSLASPMVQRKSEAEGRLISTKEFKELIEQYRRCKDEPFRTQLLPILKEYENWIDDMSQQQGSKAMYDEPILKVVDIENKKNELTTKYEAIMNPPKPKEEKKEDKPSTNENKTNDTKQNQNNDTKESQNNDLIQDQDSKQNDGKTNQN